MKVIKVEADYPAWKAYASARAIHGAVTGFLESNRDSFYKVETTAYGKNYVTARGWEDLSDMIKLYEEDGRPVSDSLICQYITDEKTVKDFSAYYDLYNKYRKQYDVETIFAGKLTDATAKAAADAPVDERLALTGLLADTLKSEIRDVLAIHRVVKQVRGGVSTVVDAKAGEAAGKLDTLIDASRTVMSQRSRAGSMSNAEKTHYKRIIKFYTDAKVRTDKGENIKSIYNETVTALKADVTKQQTRIDNLFDGMDRIFGADSNEMLVLVTELTLCPDTSEFLADFGSGSYEKYNSVLKVGDRTENLRRQILELDELK